MSLRTSNGNTTSVQHQLAKSGDISYRDRSSRGVLRRCVTIYPCLSTPSTVLHCLPLPLRLSVVRYFTSRNVKHLTFSSDDHLGQDFMCGVWGFIGDHTTCSISMVFLGRKKLGIVVLVRGYTRTV